MKYEWNTFDTNATENAHAKRLAANITACTQKHTHMVAQVALANEKVNESNAYTKKNMQIGIQLKPRRRIAHDGRESGVVEECKRH